MTLPFRTVRSRWQDVAPDAYVPQEPSEDDIALALREPLFARVLEWRAAVRADPRSWAAWAQLRQAMRAWDGYQRDTGTVPAVPQPWGKFMIWHQQGGR